MKKILITGASGFLGYHLTKLAAEKFEVHGLYHTSTFKSNNCTAHSIDITNYIDLGDLIEDIEPDAIIHAAALANANFCEQHPEQSYLVNVETTANLAGICCDYQIPFVFTSTDLVFDGKEGNYSEDSEANPIMTYGKHKLQAEQEVQRIYPAAFIARLPLLFGDTNAKQGNYLQQFITDNKAGKTATLFYDEYRTLVGAKSVSKGILQFMDSYAGILHLGGPQKISRFDFGVKAAEIFGLDVALLNACSQDTINFPAPRPKDVSLNSAKAFSLGYQPLTLEEELKLIFEGNHF